MASVTRTFYDNNGYGNDSLWTVIFTGQDYTATGASITINPYHISAKYENSYPAGKGSASLYTRGHWAANTNKYINVSRYDDSGSSVSPVAWAVGTYYSESVVKPSPATVKINTSNLFNSNNSTERTANLDFVIPSYFLSATSNGSSIRGTYQNDTEWTLTLGKVTLDVPPTGTVGNITYDTTGFIYAGLTTASVDISSLTAYYGGTITDVTLKIGNQTVSRTDNGTLSILLNQGGTFTPTVVITDSRGQTKTTTFEQITVGTYNAPSLSFDAERTTSTGVPDDEGTYATVDVTLTFTDVVADAVAPTITVTDEDGVAQTVSTTWYSSRASDGTLSGSVTWANVSSGDTVYGLVSITGGFNTQKSYQITLTPEDSESTGTPITQTLATAFYTLDFLAGGHGIAFGKPAINTGFECAMDATFEADATFKDANGTMRLLFDFIHPIGSYYETSDTAFDPNVSWGGTWVLETEGQVHVSAGTNYIVGSTGGEATHTLTINEMPSHSHSYTKYSGSGVQGASGTSYWVVGNPTDASLSTSTTGGGQAHNNMQPYIVVNRWHRTA